MLLSVFLPLFNFLTIGLFGRFLGKIGTMYVTTVNMVLTTILNIKLFYLVVTLKTSYFVLLSSWIRVDYFDVNWEFILDPLAVTMLAMVSIISTLVHMYSFAYMSSDPHFVRFVSYLSLFTFFMFILVTASNFIQLFMGWEGVGICSYLLINFWFTRVQANKAAIKAMLMNRIGDIGFMIGMVLAFGHYKTFDFTLLAAQAGLVGSWDAVIQSAFFTDFAIHDLICFFLVVGVMGKSAQLGLHTWLPAAMEGPTPVSALIHAATMVTAGVFLLIRTSFLFELSPKVKVLIIVLGALTALLSAATAMFLFDIKRIIAYSTCSQLGYMALACGLAQYNIGLFHLINHAFFKALLFLTAGAIIHSFNNEQDMRKLGGLYPRMPFILSAITIGNIAIMGLPFLTGYYSKDLIIEAAYLNGNIFGLPFDINLIAFAVLLAAFCTASYSFRMYYYLFLRRNVVPHHELSGTKSQTFFIQLALGTLMVGSIFIGYLLSDLFQATNDFFYHTNFESAGVVHTYFENEFLPYHIKLLPLFFSLAGFIGGLIYVWHLNYVPRYTQILLALVSDDHRRALIDRNKFGSFYLWITRDYSARAGRIASIFQYNYYFNELYNYIALCSYYSFYKNVFLNIDKGILEALGPTGISKIYLWVVHKVGVIFKQGLWVYLVTMYITILSYLFIMEYLF